MYRLTAVASSPGPPTAASNPGALPDKHAELQDGGGGGESTPLDPSFTVRVSVCLSCLYSFATPGLQDSRLRRLIMDGEAIVY